MKQQGIVPINHISEYMWEKSKKDQASNYRNNYRRTFYEEENSQDLEFQEMLIESMALYY